MKFHDVLPDLLGTKAKACLLQALLVFPSAQKTGREWAEVAGVSPPQAQMALRTFENYRMVSWRPAGKSRVWTLNANHVFVLALSELLDVRLDFQTAFTDGLRSKLDAKTFSKIQEITLYGSVARNQDGHGSDIDVFLAVSDPDVAETVRQACLGVSVDFLDRFGKVVMPLVWSKKDFTDTNPGLLKNIRHDGITFYGGALHATNR
ncbi:nucleotidyltransferase domain-containing protein [Candidatus Micrarchaeota archaeon]|nr:nucleotidyltransferase domain-containing protein [Candidatus Micrarchaeota archaeon]